MATTKKADADNSKALRLAAEVLLDYAEGKGFTAPNPYLNAAQMLQAVADEMDEG